MESDPLQLIDEIIARAYANPELNGSHPTLLQVLAEHDELKSRYGLKRGADNIVFQMLLNTALQPAPHWADKLKAELRV